LGGVLYFLAYLGFGVWPLIFVFLVPLWWALDRVRARGVGAALLVGSTFGGVAFAGGFPWLLRLVPVFLAGNRFLGGALWLAYGAWFAFGFGVYAALFHAICRRGWPLLAAGVAPLVALEWLQPQIFPVHAGTALLASTTWVQIADLGGPLLLTAFVGAENVAAYAVWRWWSQCRRPRDADEAEGPGVRRAAPLPIGLAAAGLAAAVFFYGRARIAGVDGLVRAAPTLRVGVVQANLGVLEKRKQGIVTHRRHLEQTHELLGAGDVDLIVWPETAYVRGLRRPLPIAGQLIREDVKVPLLFGGTAVDEVDGRRVKSNAAFLVGPDGMIRDAYDKNLLIPLAEYAPFVGLVPALGSAFPNVQQFRAADRTPPLHLGSWRIATPICYEAIRPEFVRRMMREGRPHLLVTLANDAWFGDSQEPALHLALASLRAVEHRRFLVRSTNSGISAIVDPAGRVAVRTGVLTRENLRATVGLLEGETVYARFGDWSGWVCALASLTMLLVRAPRRS
jgi:apolipoprotein N-acyltransferase